ncbi:MAG: ATP-binding protein [Acidobacteriota bacterium]|jgi:replication-associated recombination protein RarA
MLFGREKEIRKLVLNMQRGIHTLVFGAPGVGKSAILKEVSNRLSRDEIDVVYVNDCRSRRILLEEAVKIRQSINAQIKNMSVKDLRNALLKSGKKQRLCLILDHLPKLHHPLQHLLEIMEESCVLAFGVTGLPGSYDLHYWKFKSLEIKDLPRKAALSWIGAELRNMSYSKELEKTIASEIFRLTGGNPGSTSQTLYAIRSQSVPIDDPIRIRRMFVDGKISRFSDSSI